MNLYHMYALALGIIGLSHTLHANPLPVTITNTKDGKDVVIPAELISYSKTLREFSQFPVQDADGAGTSTQSTQLSWPMPEGIDASYEDILRLIGSLAAQHDNQNISLRCKLENAQTNIMQLKLADYFDIEFLFQYELEETTQKLISPIFLTQFQQDSLLLHKINNLPPTITQQLVQKVIAQRPYQCEQVFIEKPINQCQFSNDGTRLLTMGRDETIQLWDTKTRQCLYTFRSGHGTNDFDYGSSITFNHDGTMIATTLASTTNIDLWDALSGKKISTLIGHASIIYSTHFNHDGTQLISASDDATARIWNINTSQCIHILQGHTDYVSEGFFNYDGTRAITYSGDAIRVWDTQTGQCLFVFNHETDELKLCDDNLHLLAASMTGMTSRWNIQTGQLIYTHQLLPINQYFRSFNHNEVQAASMSANDNTIQIWNLQTKQHIQTFEGHTQKPWSIKFNHDGTHLFSCANDNTFRIWDLQTGQCVQTHETPDEPWICAISPDSTHIVCSFHDNPTRMWKKIIIDTKHPQAIEHALLILLAHLQHQTGPVNINKPHLKKIFESLPPTIQHDLIKRYQIPLKVTVYTSKRNDGAGRA